MRDDTTSQRTGVSELHKYIHQLNSMNVEHSTNNV